MLRTGDWFESEAGSRLVRSAMADAAPRLSQLVGHNALVLQPARLPMPHLPCHSLLRLDRRQARLHGDFDAEDAALPLANDCLALVYAAFVLESSPAPAALLGEFERVLLADGHLALLALNPFSPGRFSADWRGLALHTAGHWQRQLRQAGFELLLRESFGGKYRPAACRPVHFLLARKRRIPLTPVRPHSRAVALSRKPSVP